jgi:oxygen-independent coproporphyrinogen III oxidase
VQERAAAEDAARRAAPGLRRDASLYVHVPFCESKCAYCDFYSVAHDGSREARYVEALAIEIARRAPEGFLPPTVFVGGGTPTALDDRDFARMLEVVASWARPGAASGEAPLEWTVECNPNSLTPAKAAAMRAAGVTRVSIGVQSFDDEVLRSVGRVHDGAQARAAVAAARAAGIPQVSIDLLFAIPGQGLATFERDLDEAVSLGTDHVSAYALLYEPGTTLERKKRVGRVRPEDEDVELTMLRLARERLGAAGFVRYEISNFARAGRECRHNLVYWRNGEYLGVGASAASYLDGERRSNVASWVEWQEAMHAGREAVATSERLDARRAMGEEVMCRLRLAEGLSLAELSARWGIDAESRYARVVDRLVGAGLLETRGDRVALSEQGLAVADGVIREFLRAP